MTKIPLFIPHSFINIIAINLFAENSDCNLNAPVLKEIDIRNDFYHDSKLMNYDFLFIGLGVFFKGIKKYPKTIMFKTQSQKEKVLR